MKSKEMYFKKCEKKKKSIGLIFIFFPFPSFLFLFFLFFPLIFLLSYFPSTFLQSKEGLRGIRVPLVRSISKEKLVKITILLHGIRLLCITFNIFLPSTRSTYIYIYILLVKRHKQQTFILEDNRCRICRQFSIS